MSDGFSSRAAFSAEGTGLTKKGRTGTSEGREGSGATLFRAPQRPENVLMSVGLMMVVMSAEVVDGPLLVS